MKKFILIIFQLLLLFFFGSCDKPIIQNDPTPGNTIIANYVKTYLEYCPDFFIPPVYGNLTGTIKNQTGAVAWTPSGLTGNPPTVETKDGYIARINKATRKDITQGNWNQYICTTNDCGYPGYLDGSIQIPSYQHQAGFVCYSLVYRAHIDAGFNKWVSPPLNIEQLLSKFEMLTDLEAARVGDVAAFDWDQNNEYEHVGIIIKKDTNPSNKRNWKIVSSIGIVEIFKYGAKDTRLGVFGTTNGGEFTTWNSAWENWKCDIFALKTNP